MLRDGSEILGGCICERRRLLSVGLFIYGPSEAIEPLLKVATLTGLSCWGAATPDAQNKCH